MRRYVERREKRQEQSPLLKGASKKDRLFEKLERQFQEEQAREQEAWLKRLDEHRSKNKSIGL